MEDATRPVGSKPAILISLIIPVYNTAAYLEDCVSSITSQEFEDYELILVDDGSTDGAGSICDRFSVENPRITVIHQENSGVSAARNHGMAVASGRYIWFCDSDDQIVPGALTKIADILWAKSPDVLVFEAEQVDDAGARQGYIPAPRASERPKDGPLQCKDLLYPFVHVFRRELADDLSFDTSLSLLEDRDFFYKVCLRAAGHIVVLREPLYRYLITRKDSAVNSSSVSKYVAATRVHESILESELLCGRPNPAYELFVTFSLSVLTRAYRYGAPREQVEELRARLRRHKGAKASLPPKQRMKLFLAMRIPVMYKMLALASAGSDDEEPGSTIVNVPHEFE